jgi:hypothetical protein
MRSALYPSPNSPTNSFEEAEKKEEKGCPFPSGRLPSEDYSVLKKPLQRRNRGGNRNLYILPPVPMDA